MEGGLFLNQHLVSVITPCWNAERFLAETVNSVLSQSYSNWELLLIDDGSTDNTPELCEALAEADTRIRVFHQNNSGSASARNLGIQNAKGRYIALLDADDLWYPQFLEKQLKCLQESDAVCVSCGYEIINEFSEPVGKAIYPPKRITYRAMTVRNRIGCLSAVYDTQKYGKRFLRPALKSIRDDYAFWLDVVSLEGYAIGNRETLAGYRVVPHSTTGNKRKLIPQQYKFYREYLQQPPLIAAKNVLLWGIAGVFKFYIP